MKCWTSRWARCAAAVIIVMLEAIVRQHGFAQWRPQTIGGVRFGPPLKASLALGMTYGNCMAGSEFAGPMALGEVGFGGARASLGYLFAGPFASAIEVMGSAVRTFGSPAQLERNQTLAGGEFRVAYFLVNAGIGVFRPVSGFTNDRRTRVFLNVGLGF